MPDRDAIVEAVKTHCRAESALDKPAWLALYADDIVLEDPVGTPPIEGIEALSTRFWAGVERAQPKVELIDEVIVCGNEAIATLCAEINADGGRRTLRPIVVHLVFNAAGRIERLRSFFNYG